jgi:hypothetical protein
MVRAAAQAASGARGQTIPVGCDGVSVVDSYAECAVNLLPECLSGPILRTRSVSARSILASLSSGGEYDHDGLCDVVRSSGAPPRATLTDSTRRTWLAELARVMAAQTVYDDDQSLALSMLDAICSSAGPDALDSQRQTVYGQLLFLQGSYRRADEILPQLTQLRGVVAEYLHTDLKNPFIRADRDTGAWLSSLNGPLERAGLERLHLLPDGPAPFDRLAAHPPRSADAGTLVSVIITVYRPDEGLHNAVRSILGQTWTDLELIIVDDASGHAYEDAFTAIAAQDPRVKLVRQEVNGGTYIARNAGLDAASGEFVTFQDYDDWSHPRRIEHQVAPLLDYPALMGTRSLAVRARDNLTHQWLGYPPQRVNASSLLFRRKPVLAKVGYFDSVRKSADFEFAFRMEIAFNCKIANIMKPLAYTRLRQFSLSRSDFTLGWSAPGRIAYQAAYRHWHRALADGADPYLPRRLTTRPFPAPAPYVDPIAPAVAPRRHYDTVLVDDWMPHSGPKDGAREEIRILTDRGFAVGIVHAEAVARMAAKRQHIDEGIQELVNAGTIDRVTLDQDVGASLVIVRDPAVLQFTQTGRAAMRAGRVVIVPTLPPTGYPGLRLGYDRASCIVNARGLFGLEPSWGGVVSAPVDVDQWATPRNRWRSTRPVIGRYSADTVYSWPDTAAELLRAYPEAADLDVRILGGVQTAARVLGRSVPETWLVYDSDQISLRAYLNQLDFFVYFPNSAQSWPPVDLLALAIASGAVAVLPERFGERFGQAAVYCTPADLMPTVRRLYDDADGYRRQVLLGREYVRIHHSPVDYGRDVEKLMSVA